jgi:arsenate reductase-like glutaredoxin family protein
MLKATSSIKRPIVETEKGILLGFVVADFEQEFQ